jgi:hypothetical protein
VSDALLIASGLMVLAMVIAIVDLVQHRRGTPTRGEI